MSTLFRLVFWKLAAIIAILIPFNLYSQVARQNPNPNVEYRETRGDTFVSVAKFNRLTSPAYNYSTPRITTYQVNVNNAGRNILGDAANEPSIAIDQKNPNRIYIAWRQFDTISSNFRQAGYGFSLDGGKTWKVPGPLEPGIFRSDPVLDSDGDGTIYFNSLEENFLCHVFKSTSKNTWNQKTLAYGGDKQWMIIDKNKKYSNNNIIYANWSASYSTCAGSFTRSIDNGFSYEDCSSPLLEPKIGTMAIGPNGELYLCGGSFYVSKSSNASNPNEEIRWDFSSYVDLDGWINYHASINPEGILGQAWIATDTSKGPTRGNVYLLCSVYRTSKNDDADVMFARSTDGGSKWSKPRRINDDSLVFNLLWNWNWFGTMSVAPNGRIDVIWLDTRNDSGGFNSQLYYSSSKNGGLSWSKNESLSKSFDPHMGWPNQSKMGDYYHMISTNDGAHLAWAATFNGEQDVYYSFIHADTITEVINYEHSELTIASLSQNIPNPFSNITNINYSLKKSAKVKLEILDVTLSKSIKMLVNENKIPGDYMDTWNGTNNNGVEMPSGIYFYRLSVGGEKGIYRKMLLMR